VCHVVRQTFSGKNKKTGRKQGNKTAEHAQWSSGLPVDASCRRGRKRTSRTQKDLYVIHISYHLTDVRHPRVVGHSGVARTFVLRGRFRRREFAQISTAPSHTLLVGSLQVLTSTGIWIPSAVLHNKLCGWTRRQTDHATVKTVEICGLSDAA